MTESVPVESDGMRFWVEVPEASGVQTVGLGEAFSFDGVRETVTAVASQLQAAWEVVRPSEAEVEFGVKVTAKSGKLSGLLVEGGGEATLKVKLIWRDGPAASPPVVQVVEEVAGEGGAGGGDGGEAGSAGGDGDGGGQG